MNSRRLPLVNKLRDLLPCHIVNAERNFGFNREFIVNSWPRIEWIQVVAYCLNDVAGALGFSCIPDAACT